MKTSSKLTSKESFAILHKIENEKYPTDGSIKLSDWCDQMQKARLEAIKDLVPEVGLGCTICYYSDKRAATVTKKFPHARLRSLSIKPSVLIITLESTRFYPNLKAMQKYSLKEETDIG